MKKIIWRIIVLRAKISGRLKRLGWIHVLKILFNMPIIKPVKLTLIKEDRDAGIGLYKSDRLPELWIPLQNDPGCDIDQYLFDYDLYHATYIGDMVSGGDTVMDCGGYIGLFSLWCLKKGADQIIVFEPEKRNCECIKRNLASYIDSGKVILIENGVWSCCSDMNLKLTDSGVGHSLLDRVKAVGSTTVKVVDIDSVVQNIECSKINFIKMDIEGAERKALLGAEKVIIRDRPKMFICSYHLPDDPKVITNIVLKIRPDYTVNYTGVSLSEKGITQEQGVVFV